MTPGAPHQLGRLQLRGILFYRDIKAAAAIEMAFALPAYLALLFGVMDMGWMFWKQVTLDRAVLMSARCGAVRADGCTTANGIGAFAAANTPGLATSQSLYTVTSPSCGIKVEATLNHNLFFAQGTLGTVTLRASSCMARTDVIP